MKKLKITKNLYKITFLVVLVLIVFRVLNISQTQPLQLNEDEDISSWVSFYHDQQCEYSFFEILNSYKLEYEISIRNEPSGSIECVGKNFWIDYSPEKRIEDGWKEFSPRKFVVRVATNLHIDLIVQSIIWLTFLSMIPKDNNNLIVLKKIPILFGILLFYLHFIGESNYYSTIGRDYYPYPVYRDYDSSIIFDNFHLYSYLLIFLYLFYILRELLKTRIFNLINYFPFIFLVYGSFTSLNLNFFVVVLSFIGLHAFFSNEFNIKYLFSYIAILSIWIFNSENNNTNFDVDKIKGFVNTSQTNVSVIFWSIVFYLVLIGVKFLVDNSKKNINLDLITNNLLFTSSLIVVIGLLSSFSVPINFVSFYVLGHNKTGMGTIQSVEGNAWRGLYPSAESIGEFFGFVILFTLITFLTKKFTLKTYHILLLLINFYGLYRANNASAVIMITLIIVIIIVNHYVSNKKQKKLIYLLLTILLLCGFIFLIFSNSFQLLSGSVMFEAVKASSVDYNFELNEYNQSAIEEANYALLLSLPPESTNFSSSLEYLLNSYTYGNKIDNLPSALSLVSSVSYFINRSEKWGIFIAKYNPNMSELFFGYGPGQLAEYYLGHETKFQDGLVLPHSSFLSFLIFFGIVGLISAVFLVFYFLFNNKDDFYGNLLAIYFLINFIKSDSLLYFSSFLIFVILINFLRIKSLFLEDKI